MMETELREIAHITLALALARVAAVAPAQDQPASRPTSAPDDDRSIGVPTSQSAPASPLPDWPAPVAAADAWPMFRGSPSLHGLAPGPLPDRLEVLWRVTLPEAIDSSAAIVDGTVFVGCDDSHLYALDLATGQQKWKYDAGAEIRSSPTVLAGTVYFGDEIGLMHAVSAADGAPRWKLTTEGSIYSCVNYWSGRIYFGSYDGALYCVDPRDGRVLWKHYTADKIHGTPGLRGDALLIAGCDSRLHVIDAATGKSRQEIPLGSVCGAAAVSLDQRVFLGTYGNQVLGVDLAESRVAWRFEDVERKFPFMASAAVHDGLVLLGGRDKRFRALDAATGQERWSFAPKGRIDSSAVVVGQRVFFGATDGTLYALDAAGGRELWRFEAGDSITASPAVAASRLVIGTLDGSLFCFGAKP